MMVLFSGKGMKMKVQKYEIARVIDKLKSIVQKNDQFPALGGILVKDGYLIASNSEITMKVKLEASEGSYFIIPMKAFDLIKNLPDGEIDISATDKNVVMIKIGAIKNKYQSYPPEEFNFDITEDPEADGVELNGKKIMEAISHVIYAAADGGANTQMTGIYFEGTDSGVSLAALDGHMVAVDSVKAEGAKDMKLIVPKATAKKLISMGVIDDVTLTYTKNSAVFKSDEYTIYTRLIPIYQEVLNYNGRSNGMIKILLSKKLGEMRLTQADLARATGIRPNTINELYHELADRVNLEHLDLICEALDCELDELIVRVPNKESAITHTRQGTQKPGRKR